MPGKKKEPPIDQERWNRTLVYKQGGGLFRMTNKMWMHETLRDIRTSLRVGERALKDAAFADDQALERLDVALSDAIEQAQQIRWEIVRQLDKIDPDPPAKNSAKSVARSPSGKWERKAGIAESTTEEKNG